MIKMVIVQKINHIKYVNTKQLRKLTYFVLNHYGRNSSPVTYFPAKTIDQKDAEAHDFNVFDKACEETLESLTEFFEDLVENNEKLAKADVSYSDGVLTINLGEYGTYVINRQTPNRQIWLSSPLSGPKRYDYVVNGSYWIYKHDSISLHELLEKEIGNLLEKKVDFSKCVHAKR